MSWSLCCLQPVQHDSAAASHVWASVMHALTVHGAKPKGFITTVGILSQAHVGLQMQHLHAALGSPEAFTLHYGWRELPPQPPSPCNTPFNLHTPHSLAMRLSGHSSARHLPSHPSHQQQHQQQQMQPHRGPRSRIAFASPPSTGCSAPPAQRQQQQQQSLPRPSLQQRGSGRSEHSLGRHEPPPAVHAATPLQQQHSHQLPQNSCEPAQGWPQGPPNAAQVRTSSSPRLADRAAVSKPAPTHSGSSAGSGCLPTQTHPQPRQTCPEAQNKANPQLPAPQHPPQGRQPERSQRTAAAQLSCTLHGQDAPAAAPGTSLSVQNQQQQQQQLGRDQGSCTGAAEMQLPSMEELDGAGLLGETDEDLTELLHQWQQVSACPQAAGNAPAPQQEPVEVHKQPLTAEAEACAARPGQAQAASRAGGGDVRAPLGELNGLAGHGAAARSQQGRQPCQASELRAWAGCLHAVVTGDPLRLQDPHSSSLSKSWRLFWRSI